MDAPGGREGPDRMVEEYESLVELDMAVFIRSLSGWRVLTAGQVRPGRWWAEYQAGPDGDSPA